MPKNKLAIIIPAYKSTYLEEALVSIVNQTCKDFTLYIGDDCSPYDLKTIITSFEKRMEIVYKRFDTNLGGKDLVAQWERCVDMNQGEEWLWLFSDDDIMEPKCVEEFYRLIKEKPKARLIHFEIKQIDKHSNIKKPLPPFGNYLTAKQYLDGKIKGCLISFVVEFIVHREIFYGCGRFQNFDLAWGSDFISWIKFAQKADGIYTCPSAQVNWRSSGDNISTDESNITVYRKMRAIMHTSKWILDFTIKNGYTHPYFYSKFSLGELFRKRKKLTFSQNVSLIILFIKEFHSHLFQIIADMMKYPFYKSIL